MLRKAVRLFQTVRYLKPVQLLGRVGKSWTRLRLDHAPAPAVRPVAAAWALPRWREPSMLSERRFIFLGQAHDVVAPDDWNDARRSRLWTYNLHYFDDLDAEGGERRRAWHEALIARWIAENAEGGSPGWEPYCLSMRVVNWCRFAWRGGRLSPEAIQSLAVQVRALRAQLETHLLGNHLFANAKALVFAGLFFEGAEADAWLKTGLRLLEAELEEEVLADGGHFELSPMYHNIIAMDVLELIQADRIAPGRVSAGVRDALDRQAPAMLAWSAAMSHGDLDIAYFNDAARGVAPSQADMLETARALGLETEQADAGLIWLKPSGYVRATVGEAVLIADVGRIGPDYIPGHAHADVLSFELSLGEHRLVVNTGVSDYANSPVRHFERSTAAHNTVVVDGRNSSDVWSAFRVGARARPRAVRAAQKAEGLVIEAAHDGYKSCLGGDGLHHRTWRMTARELMVEDLLSRGRRSAVSYIHLGPSVMVRDVAPGVFDVALPTGHEVRFWWTDAVVEVEDGYWVEQFGVRVPTKVLRAKMQGDRAGLTIRW